VRKVFNVARCFRADIAKLELTNAVGQDAIKVLHRFGGGLGSSIINAKA